jgi:hypothetical protein
MSIKRAGDCLNKWNKGKEIKEFDVSSQGKNKRKEAS